MKIQPRHTLTILWLCANLSLARVDAQSNSKSSGPAGVDDIAITGFDPVRDPQAGMKAAQEAARRAGKRILLDVGGDWCAWCHALDQLFSEHADLSQFRDSNYVTLKVYYGADNRNELFFARYPKLAGIPHIFVLDADGSVLASQHVVDLQSDGTYSASKVKAFLEMWSRRGVQNARDAPPITAAKN